MGTIETEEQKKQQERLNSWVNEQPFMKAALRSAISIWGDSIKGHNGRPHAYLSEIFCKHLKINKETTREILLATDLMQVAIDIADNIADEHESSWGYPLRFRASIPCCPAIMTNASIQKLNNIENGKKATKSVLKTLQKMASGQNKSGLKKTITTSGTQGELLLIPFIVHGYSESDLQPLRKWARNFGVLWEHKMAAREHPSIVNDFNLKNSANRLIRTMPKTSPFKQGEPAHIAIFGA